MAKFVNGLFIDKKEFDNGGMILKCSIDMTRFYEENPTTEKGYFNFEIKFNKGGKPYAQVNEFYHKDTDTKKEEQTVTFGEITEDEIPF